MHQVGQEVQNELIGTREALCRIDQHCNATGPVGCLLDQRPQLRQPTGLQRCWVTPGGNQ
jgi:hypothetical protein